MNRSKIEWCDHTWNPITGCRHGCKYCYARTMTKRFAGDVRLNLMAKGDYSTTEAPDGSGPVYILDKPMLNETGHPLAYPFWFEPTLHRYRMNVLDKLKMGNNIFVGAMADVFGSWVPDEWIRNVLDVCRRKQQHNFLFLTKNPARYLQYGVPGNANLWYGTTITKAEDMHRTESLLMEAHTFVSIEPIHERFGDADLKTICSVADWIIVGAETGQRAGKIVPEFEWIKDIVLAADTAGKPVFMKDSLIKIVGEENMRRDCPAQLKKKSISKKMQNKLFGECCSCKGKIRKKDMVTLLARLGRGQQPKQYGFMCRTCFAGFCREKGIDLPDGISEHADGARHGTEEGEADGTEPML